MDNNVLAPIGANYEATYQINGLEIKSKIIHDGDIFVYPSYKIVILNYQPIA